MSEPNHAEPDFFYSSPWIDRAAHLRGDETWLRRARSSPDARYLLVREDRNLVAGDDPPAARTLAHEELDGQLDVEPALFLGLEGDRPWFALPVPPSSAPELPAGCAFADLRRVGPLMPPREAGLLAYARAIVHWHATHRYCGACGAPTRVESAGYQRVCESQECGRLHFPRTDPAIIVRVVHEDRILLGRQAAWPPGWYSVLAGFVEPGESLEDAVRREVAEETGVAVGDVRYVGSQPWPFPASLMVGFAARARTAEIRRADDELEDARWFTRAEIREQSETGRIRLSPPTSISRALIDGWLEP